MTIITPNTTKTKNKNYGLLTLICCLLFTTVSAEKVALFYNDDYVQIGRELGIASWWHKSPKVCKAVFRDTIFEKSKRKSDRKKQRKDSNVFHGIDVTKKSSIKDMNDNKTPLPQKRAT